jgi:hypothetical protein
VSRSAATAAECKWLVIIILRKHSIGNKISVLNGYHPDARELFERTHDLHRVNGVCGQYIYIYIYKLFVFECPGVLIDRMVL